MEGLQRGRGNQAEAGDGLALAAYSRPDALASKRFDRTLLDDALQAGGDLGQGLLRHTAHGQ